MGVLKRKTIADLSAELAELLSPDRVNQVSVWLGKHVR